MLFKAVLGTDVQFLAIPSCHLRGGGGWLHVYFAY